MFMRPNYELSAIDETRGEDRIEKPGENNDCTLMKYFFPEDNSKLEITNKNQKTSREENIKQPAPQSNSQCKKIQLEKFEKMFRKPIKLRNALKQCYWDRQPISFSNVADDVIPDILITKSLLQEIHNYVFNDFYGIYLGNLLYQYDRERKTLTYLAIERGQNHPGSSNFLMNPKLMDTKVEVKESLMSIIEKAYKNIKSLTVNDNSLYLSGIFNFHFYFNRETSLDNSNRTNLKAYCLLPNINLEMKRINKITLSKNALSKFLVNGKNETEHININDARNGYLAMSSKHRLITLYNNEASLKEILFGIWIYTPEEKINKSQMNDQSFSELIDKYKILIYEKCLSYVLKSKKIEVINSPSPDEGVFLLVLFFSNYQCFLEVKLMPNEKDKVTSLSEFSQYSNDWLIMKKKLLINFEQGVSGMTIKLKPNSVDKILTVRNYINKKFMVSGAKSFQGTSSMNKLKSNPNTQTITNSISTNKNFKDPLNELFEEEVNYNFPLAMNNGIPIKRNHNNIPRSKQVSNMPTPTKPSIGSTENLRANLMPVSSVYNRGLNEDSESLTINSSKGFSVKSNSISRKPSQNANNHQSLGKFNTIDHDNRGISNHKKYMSMNDTNLNEILAQKLEPFKQQSNFHSREAPTNHNAYEIIYDQARSIQALQEKINILQRELETVVIKLKTQEDNSLNCSCGKKNNKNLISTGTNTSEDLHTFNQSQSKSNHLSVQNEFQKSNTNSMRSDRLKDALKKNMNQNENSGSNIKQTETDFRYDNFLNENSINYPKQFFEQYDKFDKYDKYEKYDISQSKDREEVQGTGFNVTNTQTNISNINNLSNLNLIEKNMNLMNYNYNPHMLTPSNNNNSLIDIANNINFNIDQANKEDKIFMPKIDFASYNSGVPRLDFMNKQLNSIDMTTTSIDPPSYRYVLKVPSIIYRSNNSILIEENNAQDNPLRKISIDTTRHQDYTINLPRIVFNANESVESLDEEGDI